MFYKKWFFIFSRDGGKLQGKRSVWKSNQECVEGQTLFDKVSGELQKKSAGKIPNSPKRIENSAPHICVGVRIRADRIGQHSTKVNERKIKEFIPGLRRARIKGWSASRHDTTDALTHSYLDQMAAQ
ncbi:hypothetical protein V6582_23730 [Agrobacterium vitis]|uniref:hypothetical protein n=1 Tax=Agrobacterium vitis TaxID=373 RepID=UPI0012E910D0|nr:hypothetical protein [Agrobacterium vitis]MVA26186.1 hypothetical protein [Agrobacterium vitis]